MKFAKALIVLVALGSLITFSNCGGGGTPPEPLANQQFTKLQKTWKLTAVTLDGTTQFNPTGPYNTNFTLTIAGTKGDSKTFTYAIAGRPALSPWKASGAWEFGTDAATQLVRDPSSTSDKLDMTYSVTESTLQIQFNYQGTGYTRTDQLKGNWVFIFGL
ncbi:MAG: hypothetical protein ACKOE6_00330 [Flammeovirgaceae bacterium]